MQNKHAVKKKQQNMTSNSFFPLDFKQHSGGKTTTCLLNGLDNGHDPYDQSHGSDPDDQNLNGTYRSLPFFLLLASMDHLS